MDNNIEQAQALVSDQLGCTTKRALNVIVNTALATNETIEHLADYIVAGWLRFE